MVQDDVDLEEGDTRAQLTTFHRRPSEQRKRMADGDFWLSPLRDSVCQVVGGLIMPIICRVLGFARVI